MRQRTVFAVLFLLLLGVFAALNWATFTTPTPLNLLVARTDAPLGLLMLGVVTGLTALYLLFALGLETAALLEGKRHTRELVAQRKLADEAEASRYTELKKQLEVALTDIRAMQGDQAQNVETRIERMEEALKAEIERAGNTLAAYIGELEDRLTSGGQRSR